MMGATRLDEEAGERGAGPPLFILSFRRRDELAQQATQAGWQTVAARRLEGAERRYLASGAGVAVIDARGALDDGLAAAALLGAHVAAQGGALLVLVSHGDVAAIAAFFDAGATHFLASPSTEAEFGQALRFAARHAERMAGGWRPAGNTEPLGWRCEPGAATIRLTPALAARLGFVEEQSPRQLVRMLDQSERRIALEALRRLGQRGETAFAHELAPFGRVVQHLQRDATSGTIAALIEPLGAAPDAAERVRDAWAGGRDPVSVRRWIEARLAEAEAPLAVVLVALTRFDIVNAAYGRAAGDAMLRAAERRIAEVSRDGWGHDVIVARVAGSEFLVAAGVDGERLGLGLAQLSRTLARPFAVEGTLALLGSRIGVAERTTGDDAAALMRRVGEALADAKASDGATVRIAGSDAVAPIDALAVDLHRAIDRGEIDMLFQPQVAVATGAIVGVEALARWEHPTLGSLGAEALFAAADRADLGLVLSDHIQTLALARAAAWPETLAALRLSVNLTAADIAQPDFVERFLDRVASSGFPVARLTVEITETGLIDDLRATSALLTRLRGAGLRVAIDDFGTGYSSLAYLKALPLDYLKIDKNLAQDIAGTARDRVVVRGVIEMARSLGLSVIAEGVETGEQLELLAKEGCQIYQGFLCSAAISSAALAELIAERDRC